MLEQFLEIRGTSIFLKRIGHGKKIVFLHGGPGGEHRFFLPHVEELSKQYELIFYDQNGCGQSSSLKDSSRYSMDEEVQTLEDLRVELGIEKLNLFGESWGSMLALLYAIAYPNHVNKIILTSAVGASSEGYNVFGNELRERMTAEDKRTLDELSKKFRAGEVELQEIFRVLNPYYVFSKEVLHKKTKTTSNAYVNEKIGSDIKKNYDIRKELHKITHIPILVLQGDHDLITPESLNQLLLQYIPHANLLILEYCGHWTVVEKPEEVMNAVRAFI